MVFNTRVVSKVKRDLPEILFGGKTNGSSCRDAKVGLVSKLSYSSKMALFSNNIKLYALINQCHYFL